MPGMNEKTGIANLNPGKTAIPDKVSILLREKDTFFVTGMLEICN